MPESEIAYPSPEMQQLFGSFPMLTELGTLGSPEQYIPLAYVLLRETNPMLDDVFFRGEEVEIQKGIRRREPSYSLPNEPDFHAVKYTLAEASRNALRAIRQAILSSSAEGETVYRKFLGVVTARYITEMPNAKPLDKPFLPALYAIALGLYDLAEREDIEATIARRPDVLNSAELALAQEWLDANK